MSAHPPAPPSKTNYVPPQVRPYMVRTVLALVVGVWALIVAGWIGIIIWAFLK